MLRGFLMKQPSSWIQGNMFISIMADFELFFIPLKDKFNKYAQTMGRGRKGIILCVQDMML